MSRAPQSRRERRERSSKTLKRILIGLGLTVPILYFVFTKLLFDPFEGSQPSFPALVPRDVDVFVHRLRLDSDISEFPRPALFDRLSATSQYKEWAQSEAFAALDWPEQVEAAVAELQGLTADSPLDPLADLLGEEVALVGRLPVAGTGDPQFALLARISGRTKLALEALQFGWVLKRVLPGATLQTVSDPSQAALSWQRLDLPAGAMGAAGTVGAGGASGPGGRPWFFARRLDLLVIGQHEPLVRDVVAAVDGPRENSLGLSRLYLESLPPAPGAPDERFSSDFLLDIGQLLKLIEGQDELEAVKRDALANLLPRLVDPTLLGEAVGRLDLDEHVSLRLHADVDSVKAREAHTGLMGTAGFPAAERLRDVMALLPADTSVVLTMNVELRALLQSFISSLSPDVLELMNSTLRDLRRYNQDWMVDNVQDLAGQLDRMFGGEITIALRPLDHEVMPGTQPLPLVAVFFRVRDLSLFTRLDEAVVRGHKALGLDSKRMWLQDEGVGVRKWLGLPAGLPMEEMSYVVLDGATAVIATDDDFAREIVACYTRSKGSLAAKPDVRQAIERLGSARANFAAWGSTSELLRLLAPYAEHVADDRTRIELGPLRVTKQREILAAKYASYVGREGAMPADLKAKLDAELDAVVSEIERVRLEVEVPRLAKAWRDGQRWLSLFGQVCVALQLGERDAQFALEATTALKR
ncbi:MAG: hypothetical protein ACT4PU_07280 [Planctomycetota bacterium]